MYCFPLAKPSGLSLEQPVRLQIKDHADNGLRAGFLFCMGVSNLTVTQRKASGFCTEFISRLYLNLLVDQ